jgi:signal transduction histidine kinase
MPAPAREPADGTLWPGALVTHTDLALEAFELAPSLMGVVEPTEDGDILHLCDNQAARAFFGLAPGATVGRRASSLGASQPTLHRWLDHCRKSTSSGSPVRFECAYANSNGEEWVVVAIRPARETDDGRRRFLYVAERIAPPSAAGEVEPRLYATRTGTEQKEREDELRRRIGELTEADRRKDDFLAMLAHELRNPLAPIRNAAQLLMMNALPDPKLTWSLDVIDRQVQHMARMLEDVLDLARVSREELELRKQPVAIQATVSAAVETIRPLFEASRHELTLKLPPDPIWVQADPARLAQIFANILDNAAKYTPERGAIAITVEGRLDTVSVTVSDNGIGIDADTLPLVFESFTRAQPAVGRSRGGLGIGLSLVSRLVALHGGTVTARSDGMSCGSEFVVELPTIRGAPKRVADA